MRRSHRTKQWVFHGFSKLLSGFPANLTAAARKGKQFLKKLRCRAGQICPLISPIPADGCGENRRHRRAHWLWPKFAQLKRPT